MTRSSRDDSRQSKMVALLAILLAVVASLTEASIDGRDQLDLLMPNVSPKKKDTYLCHSIPLDREQPIYITGFVPLAKSDIAHHILIYGCPRPGATSDVWNCGEMAGQGAKSGPVCQEGSSIIYAWAKDAPELKLPEGVGFKVGGSSEIQHLVIQIHYNNVDSFLDGGVDHSGVRLIYTPKPLPRQAGVLLLGTGGSVQAGMEEHFEAACPINDDIILHPFAFRTHAHQLGLVISGYRVRGAEWTEIGRRSPQLAQMFFPANPMTIKKGDIVAARCTMRNFKDHEVGIGSTNEDEMCNFYMMYYVDGEKTLTRNTCFSAGPPHYYWKGDKSLDVSKVPADASVIPPPPNGPDPEHPEQHMHHGRREQDDDDQEMALLALMRRLRALF